MSEDEDFELGRYTTTLSEQDKQCQFALSRLDYGLLFTRVEFTFL